MSTTDHTREALADLLMTQTGWDWPDGPGVPLTGREACQEIADAILASPWLAAHVAAMVEGKDAEIERLTGIVNGLCALCGGTRDSASHLVGCPDLERALLDAAEARAALAAERERIATAIEVEESETSEDSEALGLRTAARIARSTTDDTETVTYDGFGAPIVRDGGGTDG